MKKLILVLFATLLFMSCGKNLSESGYFVDAKAMVNEAKSGIVEVSYDELKSKLEAEEIRVIIDIREPSEFENGYIGMPDVEDEYPYPETFTVNIPRGLLEFKIADEDYWNDELWVEMPSKDEEIIVYCKKGGRGALAVQSLQMLGYTNVKNLLGGYRIWLDPSAPFEEAPKSSGGCG
ncbi:MAG: rhodanese-like domain-containing protein [Candidatus Marinimicrobia bacterium]|nr:rhodanese-like domain-containing protein [Candidatus Neomarinimicrobiota bacterium]